MASAALGFRLTTLRPLRVSATTSLICATKPWPLVEASSSRPSALAGTIATIRARSEEHTSELQSLMRISYAVFCLKKKKIKVAKTQQKKQHKTRKKDTK